MYILFYGMIAIIYFIVGYSVGCSKNKINTATIEPLKPWPRN